MTQKTYAALTAEVASSLADNTVGAITPAILRGVLQDFLDSNSAIPFSTLSLFGAKGDGITDDTAAINAALSSGLGVIYGAPGATYLVSKTANQTMDTLSLPYCLKIPAGVKFDLNGSTIKLANAANSIVIVTGTDSTAVSNVTFCNGTIDGNSATQTYTGPDVGGTFNPSMFFENGTNVTVHDIVVKNTRDTAGYFLALKNSFFRNLTCLGSNGHAWHFGQGDSTPFDMRLSCCFIDNIYAERCDGTFSSSIPGNCAVYTMIDCVVGKVIGRNCQGGHKIQANTVSCSFDQLLFDGNPVASETNFGSANSGIKIQGTTSTTSVQNITINSVVSQNCVGTGLFIIYCQDCAVKSYRGFNNATNGVGPDIQIGGTRSHVDTIESVQSNAANQAIYIDFNTSIDCTAGDIKIINCKGFGLQHDGQGDFSCGDITAIDTIGNMTYAVRVTETTSRGKTGVIKVTPSASNFRIGSSSNSFKFGPVIFSGSSAPLFGQITLAMSSTITTVTNANTQNVADGTTLQPIMRFSPVNSAAMAVGPVAPAFTLSGGSTFNLHHANPGSTTAVFSYEIVGWGNAAVSYS